MIKEEVFKIGAEAYREGVADGLALGLETLSNLLVSTLPELAEKLKESILADSKAEYGATVRRIMKERFNDE